MSKKTSGPTRRTFLRGLAGATACPLAGCAFPAITRNYRPNSLVSHACVGTGNMAMQDLKGLMTHRDVHITALCDVDETYLATAKKLCPDARVYRHALEMFEKEGAAIDSVNVSTPDHTHARYILDALRRGLNVYGQKPLCHELADCRRIEKLAAEKGAVTQMGTQIAAWEGDRRTVAALRSGKLGEVKHVWLFSNRRKERDAEYFNPNPKAVPVPGTLDWGEWLGDAPFRPYAASHYHPTRWRKWKEFGSSWIGDLALHLMSPVWLGLDLGRTGPTSVVAETSDSGWTDAQQAAFWPEMCHVVWTFPGVNASGMKPFEVEWCDGYESRARYLEPKFLPPGFLQDLAARTPHGALPPQGRVIEGTEGWLLSTHTDIEPYFIPRKGAASYERTPQLEPVRTHWHEYLDCCLTGGTPTSSFAWAGRLSEMALIANAAQLTPGRILHFDSEKGVLS